KTVRHHKCVEKCEQYLFDNCCDKITGKPFDIINDLRNASSIFQKAMLVAMLKKTGSRFVTQQSASQPSNALLVIYALNRHLG
ncbi:hypothetical protein AVEN_129529-1, partial [Araneus ventricosus]